jgi:predicted lipoprotein with Yx(FWY)xxD motif
MRSARLIITGASLAALALSGANAWSQLPTDADRARESYLSVPMPPGFRVEASELEGAVFADGRGRTLYTWPQHQLRNGDTGDPKDRSNCTYTKETMTDGLMSPYPAGLILPDLATRPSCAQRWPLVRAAPGAKPVGDWTIIKRKDGIEQWAYKGQALYTSALDREPGDTYGGTKRSGGLGGGDGPANRIPVGPPPDVPPGLTVRTTVLGRLLVTAEGSYSVYYYDKDGRNRSNCDMACAETWKPVLAPASARSQGAWTVFERMPGIFQWAFRGRPIYTYLLDKRPRSQEGSDVPGWHDVYLQRAPSPPREFTVQESISGEVLADAQGKTIYIYRCGDDALDQLSCDDPDDSQAYRLAMCGGGQIERCLENFPYVLAPANARSESRTWTVMEIDPKTGHRANKGQSGALRVWAYRDRPVYTYAGDEVPGDIHADSHGEFKGEREGFKAFWLRDDFFGEDSAG